MKRIQEAGQRFGRLVLIAPTENRKWLVQCDCGNQKEVYYYSMTQGYTTSCGCFHKERVAVINGRHRMSNTRFYKIWGNIGSRTTNPRTSSYQYYGARGIKSAWASFDDFRKDMEASYLEHVKQFGEKQTTIERIDVNGNYCKENCRWATYFEQADNRTNSKHLDFNGEYITVSQLAIRSGLNIKTLWQRIHFSKWPQSRWLEPSKKYNRDYFAPRKHKTI